MVTLLCVFFISKSPHKFGDVVSGITFMGCVVDCVGMVCTYKYLIAALAALV